MRLTHVHGLGEVRDGALLGELREGRGEAAQHVGQGVDAWMNGWM
jgi:hypothetical protein